MTRLTPTQKKDIATILAAPIRYQELKSLLDAYISKTVYRHRRSLERALREEGLLHDIPMRAASGQTTTIYSALPTKEWNPYQVARAITPPGYFCNLSSIYYHTLTNQVPVTIYVATEGNRAKDHCQVESRELSDDDIFQAFVLPHRMTKHVFSFQGRELVITERVSRNAIGVETVHAGNRICPKGSRITCLERALIDAVVLPQYNGGIRATIEAIRTAIPRVNGRRLLEFYDELNYVYPYWQAIGFLFDRLGAHTLAATIKKRYRSEHKFYLDHNAKTSWEFDEKWRIYYPKGVI